MQKKELATDIITDELNFPEGRIYLNDEGLNREVLKLPPAVALRVVKNWLYSIGINPPRSALERIMKEGQSKDNVTIEGPPWFKVQIGKNNILYMGD